MLYWILVAPPVLVALYIAAMYSLIRHFEGKDDRATYMVSVAKGAIVALLVLGAMGLAISASREGAFPEGSQLIPVLVYIVIMVIALFVSAVAGFHCRILAKELYSSPVERDELRSPHS